MREVLEKTKTYKSHGLTIQNQNQNHIVMMILKYHLGDLTEIMDFLISGKSGLQRKTNRTHSRHGASCQLTTAARLILPSRRVGLNNGKPIAPMPTRSTHQHS